MIVKVKKQELEIYLQGIVPPFWHILPDHLLFKGEPVEEKEDSLAGIFHPNLRAPQLPKEIKLPSAERNWESADMQDAINEIIRFLQHHDRN